ncbi:MAG: hypothetical protein ACXWDM_02765 [Nocardioides sp.]
MVILGLLLILLGALAIIAVVFDVDSIRVELLGAEISAVGLFLLGVGAGVAILWGFGILKFGTKRSLRHRREQKELAELNSKLDRVEADRRDENGTH